MTVRAFVPISTKKIERGQQNNLEQKEAGGSKPSISQYLIKVAGMSGQPKFVDFSGWVWCTKKSRSIVHSS